MAHELPITKFRLNCKHEHSGSVHSAKAIALSAGGG